MHQSPRKPIKPESQRLSPEKMVRVLMRANHNFTRTHYTTKQVPAVALGILDNGLSWEELFMVTLAAQALSHGTEPVPSG